MGVAACAAWYCANVVMPLGKLDDRGEGNELEEVGFEEIVMVLVFQQVEYV